MCFKIEGTKLYRFSCNTDWILQLVHYQKKRHRSVFFKALNTMAMLEFQLRKLAKCEIQFGINYS